MSMSDYESVMDRATHVRRLSLLRWILAFSVLSTALHFTHNYLAIDDYPDNLVGGALVQAAILVAWPLLTAIGLLGYRLYAQGRLPAAHACLLTYSFLGISTLAHFLDGSPDIPAFWFATIFTDGLAGAAVLAFAVSSMRRYSLPTAAVSSR
jgi:hypothetical protein